jgi:ribosome recycling factor
VNAKLNESKAKMDKTIQHLKTEFSKLRVGRATTAMVEGVRLEVYGSAMTIKEVAAISIPDARSITITPWDRSVIGEIEKGILAANLGITPMNDGKMIRINLPPLTEDRRKEYVKQIKKSGEDTKVAIRNFRREAMDGAKAEELSEDEMKRFEKEIQTLTDQFVKEADKIVESKSQEVSSL